jgi:hypothetical protein
MCFCLLCFFSDERLLSEGFSVVGIEGNQKEGKMKKYFY